MDAIYLIHAPLFKFSFFFCLMEAVVLWDHMIMMPLELSDLRDLPHFYDKKAE